jgi:hypothetical protein
MSIAAVTIRPIPPLPLMTIFPSWENVSEIDSMSGMAVLLAVRRNVFRPVTTGAGSELVQENTSAMSIEKLAVSVMAKTKLCACPVGMKTGVFGAPVGTFVAELVVW